MLDRDDRLRWGALVRSARQAHGLSLAEVGRRVGVSASHPGRLEVGERDPIPQVERRLFDLLDIPLDRSLFPDLYRSDSKQAFPPLLSTSVRADAVDRLGNIRNELLALEVTGLERGLIHELAVPAIESAVRALSLDHWTIAEWVAREPDVRGGIQLLKLARRVLSWAAAAVAAKDIVSLIDDALSRITELTGG